MTEPIFIEIVFLAVDFQFDSRDEVEDPLDDALMLDGIGEVTGGGSGLGGLNIDVDLFDLKRGLEVIRATLKGLGVAPSTTIRAFENGVSTFYGLE